jgi:hypothetical protein
LDSDTFSKTITYCLNKNITMKKNQKYINLVTVLCLMAIVNACQKPELPEPTSSTEANTSSAKFLFVNTTPDAPSLDLYINGTKVGNSTTFLGSNPYSVVPILGNGTSGNTSIRAKATSGTIGGVLGTGDIVFRATTTGTGNFTAIDQNNVNGANYSIFTVDSTTRPLPLRTLNASSIGDVTYFVKNTGAQISVVDYTALADKTTVVPIGVVAAGTSDPGGPRFWISQDIFRTSFASPSTAEIRVLNAVPNSNPALLYVRLRPSSGATVNVSTGSSYFMSVSVPPPPAAPPAAIVSRSVTSAFSLFTIATAVAPIAPIVYTLEVSTSSTFATVIPSATLTNVTFTPGKAYTIYISGFFGKGRTISTGILQHN